jgi:hypothetical protein
MQITPQYERHLSSLSAKRVRGEGFEIKIFSPWAVRYLEGGRTLTLGAEVNARDAGGQQIWFLKVYVEEPLSWDNADALESIDPAKAEAIMARVENALRSTGERYELERLNVEEP